MGKVVIESRPMMYPMPVVLVGADVGDRPNFMPVAWCGIGSISDRHRVFCILDQTDC